MMFCLILVILGCHPERNKPVQFSNYQFATTDASALFFKNVRQSDYDFQEMKTAKLKLYRLKDWSLDTSDLRLVIVHNWYEDQAYVMIEFGEMLREDLPLQIVTSDSTRSDTLLFDGASKENHYEVSSSLYNAILSSGAISIIGSDGISLGPINRRNFRRTMFDFYRLTEVR
ncbi:MAG: hypothetical protein KI790_06515 [Cyclobacteriaceae bacterium]|nr:hypothetical protein [Cyclobacteriaceae bacterium HetDA_MAG_MS6]